MPNRLFTPLGISTSFSGMFLIGALEALYGPSLIRLVERFHATPSTVGFVVSAHFIGGLLGVLISQGAHAKVGNKLILAPGYLFLLLGSAGFAWAPSLGLAVTASGAAGLGFGSLDYAFSHLFAVAFGSSSGKMLNLLHGFFGLGAILAPLVVAIFGPAQYPAYFTFFALLTFLTSLGVMGVRSFPTQRPAAADEPGSGSAAGFPTARSQRSRFVAAFTAMVCVFVLHVAVGSGIGSWEASYLVLRGISVEQAAAATSLFWFAMTASRFALAAVVKGMRPEVVVMISCALMTMGSLLALVPGLTVAAFAVVGFALGPVFPMALAWANQLFGGRTWVSGTLIGMSMVGGIAFPPLLGATVTANADDAMFPLALAALSLLCVLACVAITAAHVRRHGMSGATIETNAALRGSLPAGFGEH